ncbi:MAG: hypothetical protein JWO19_2516 [Bryobacterales bacterium]|nr:hypothetical protein [Bryobacterales bacterium]
MRCLFCGKELALLKRLRGGGEFCSEAHRKEYQEQYEQLALARLLHAQPPAEAAAPLGRPAALPIASDPVPESPRCDAPGPVLPQRQIHARPAIAMIEAPAPSRSVTAEDEGPAPLAGFVSEPLVPAVTTFQHAGSLELERVTSPSLPGATAGASATSAEGFLASAPRVELALSLQALDHHTRKSERGMELREFAGPAPVMELHLSPDTGNEPAGAADVMEILMSPHPPQKATPWIGVARGFPVTPAELGQLARLDFATIGFAYSDSPVSASPAAPPESPQAEPPAQPAPEAVIAPQATAAPPALVTKALPVTLHGLAAPHGKLAQTRTSAITAASDVQLPLSAALPLRPVIVFGPAPALAKVPAAAAAPVQSKPAPEKIEERIRPSVVPAPKPVQVKRAAVPEINATKVSAPAVPVPKPALEPAVVPRKESPAPRPREAAAASDTAVPSWNLEATQSGWSKLSTGVKIGIAAAVIVGLAGIAYVVTRGGGKTANEAPVAVQPTASVDSGVPISGGWIDDWANAAKSRRHISVLSGSAKLSDYRMEFQAQIQTKAIGWIFRGLNPRNYYVTKLEVVTPGLEPTVALVHFAVIDGQDENRVVIPLPMKVRVDTVYKIRFEAIGNHFITWIQGQKIDEWTDSRFGSGGVGLFSERDEQAALQGNVNVVALVPKN